MKKCYLIHLSQVKQPYYHLHREAYQHVLLSKLKGNNLTCKDALIVVAEKEPMMLKLEDEMIVGTYHEDGR